MRNLIRALACMLFMVGVYSIGFGIVTIHVTPLGSDSNDGLSWEKAKKTIQGGIDAAALVGPGDVWVAAGSYLENVILKRYVYLYGGFAGTESVLSQRNWVTNVTTIGPKSGVLVLCNNLGEQTATIDGFTITGGTQGISCTSSSFTIANNTIKSNSGAVQGAGIYCSNSSCTILNNVVSGNTTQYSNSINYGGGIYCSNYSGQIVGNMITGNVAWTNGGGLYLSQSSLGTITLRSNVISGNRRYDGTGIGGVWADSCLIMADDNVFQSNTGIGLYLGGPYAGSSIRNNTFSSNTATGITSSGNNPYIANNLVVGNGAFGISCSGAPTIANNIITSNAGGISCGNVTNAARIVNNTIVSNTSIGGAALSFSSSSTPVVANNLIAFNSTGVLVSSSVPTFFNNDVYGNSIYDYSGLTGQIDISKNISVDPVLVSRAYGNLHIQPNSPCIDRGDDSWIQNGWTDMDGETRIMSTHVDIGADEYWSGQTGGSGGASSLVGLPTTLPADNTSASVLVLTYRNTAGDLLSGRIIRFSSNRGSADSFSAATVPTDQFGQARVNLSSGTEGIATITCRDETIGQSIPVSAQISFYPVSGDGPVIDKVEPSLPIQGPFLGSISKTNTVTATISYWHGSAGRIEFVMNGKSWSKPTAGQSASLDLDMGTDLRYSDKGIWNDLRVTAYNAAGQASQSVVIHFFGLALPPSLRPALWNFGFSPIPIIADNRYQLSIDYTTPPDAFDATVPFKLGVPFLDGYSKTGLASVKGVAGVDISLDAIQYPNSKVTGDVSTYIGADLDKHRKKKFAPSLFLNKMSDLEWSLGFKLDQSYSFANGFHLSESCLGPDFSITFETPDIIEVAAAGIPLLAPLVPFLDAFFRVGVNAGFSVCLSEDGDDLRQKVDAPLGLKVSGVVSTDRSVSDWILAELEAGGALSPEIQYPGTAENAKNFWGVPFINEIALDFFVTGRLKVWTLFMDQTWEGDLWSQHFVYPPAKYPPGGNGSWIWGHPDTSFVNANYHNLAGGVSAQGDTPDVHQTQLIANTYPGAQPSLAWDGDTAVVLFTYFDPSKPLWQATQIRALRYATDGTKTEQLVSPDNDTGLDSQPQVALDPNGRLIGVWTTIVGPVDGELADTRKAKAEIAFSNYDTNSHTWNTPSLITQDGRMDINPKLVHGADGGIYLAWLKSPDNQYSLDLSKPLNPHTDIHVARWNGTNFIEIRSLTGANTKEHPGLSVRSDGSMALVWSADQDADPSTSDQRLFYSQFANGNWTSRSRVTSEDANGNRPESSPEVSVDADGVPVLYFVRSEIPDPDFPRYLLEELDVTNFNNGSWMSWVPVTQSPTLGDLSVLRSPQGKVSALWTTTSKGISDIWTSVYDASAAQQYSDPVRLTWDDPGQEPADEVEVATAWDPAGNPSAVYLRRLLEKNQRDVGGGHIVDTRKPGPADLYLLSHTPKPDLAILPGDFAVDPLDAGPGQKVKLSATVRNLRALGVKDVKVGFYDGPTLIGALVVVSPNPLLGGATGIAALEWTIPSDGKSHTLRAKADPGNVVPETDETNNEQGIGLASLDLAAKVPVVGQYLPNGQLVIEFGIENISTVATGSAVEWKLMRDDPANGTVLDQGSVPALGAGQSAAISTVWDPGQVSPGTYELFLVVDPANKLGEPNRNNNVAQSKVGLLPDLYINPVLARLTPIGGGKAKVDVTIQNIGWSAAENVKVQVLAGPPGSIPLDEKFIASLARYADVVLPFDNIPLEGVPGALWVVVNPDRLIPEVRYDNNSASLTSPVTVSGKITLETWVGSPITSATFDFSQGGTNLGSYSVALGADGSYTVPAPQGAFKLSVKLSHWLRRSVQIDTSSGSISGNNLELTNGDANLDNAVDIRDLNSIFVNFGLPTPDSDLDGSGTVDLKDMNIIFINFGLIGDHQ